MNIQRSLYTNCYSVPFIPCDTYGHIKFVMYMDFGLVTMDCSVVIPFTCKKGDLMYAYRLARLIIMRASFQGVIFSEQRRHLDSCTTEQLGLRLNSKHCK